jgi:hypothetical protein
MSDNKTGKGGKRENAGRKATKSGSGKSIYIPSDLIQEIEARIQSYKETTKTNND